MSSRSSPLAVYEKLCELDIVDRKKHSVFVTFVNADVVDNNDSEQLLGMIIPCGSFDTSEEAEKFRDEIAIKTGAPSIVRCMQGIPFPFKPGGTDQKISYIHNVEDDAEKIRESLERAKKSKKEANKRLSQEVIDRENKDTIAYFVNRLYRYVTAKTDEERHLDDISRLRKVKDRNFSLLQEYVSAHPDIFDKWEDYAKPRAKERGELLLHNMMVKHLKEIKDSLVESSEAASSSSS